MSASPVNQNPQLLRRLLRAKDRMDAMPQEDWPVRRLAQISHVSEAHFARSFNEAFGLPPHRYLLTRRIERALTLLRDTELSITDIAFQTGWRSLGTFGRVFREITGNTPGAMRQQARSEGRGLQVVPACIQGAAERPNLKTSVLEKRRHATDATKRAQQQE